MWMIQSSISTVGYGDQCVTTAILFLMPLLRSEISRFQIPIHPFRPRICCLCGEELLLFAKFETGFLFSENSTAWLILAQIFIQISMDSFTVATMNSKVCLTPPPLPFTTDFQFLMLLQTSMSLIESTITKQLSLILMKRQTKLIAANMILR